jgi:SAM-dependent MidA family methyltransferase
MPGRVGAVARRVTPLARKLAARIADAGPMTFAEYMEACLYDSEHGYYSRAEGERFHDYYTSADVHPIFGRLLARQLEEMWRAMGAPAEFQIVELGAGGGRLAATILDFAREKLPEWYASIRYVTVEISELRRESQRRVFGSHVAPGGIELQSQLPERIERGCVISNEFFDALPVHRVVFDAGKLREIFITNHDGELGEVRGEPSSPEVAEYFVVREIALEDGQQAEVNLAARDWIGRIGRSLQRGFVVTIDYGHDARELYNERHMRGTLLAYQDHRASENFYDAPGEQDLTAHVNFSDLESHGEAAGLRALGRVSQAQFLLALGRDNEFADLYDGAMSEPDRIRARLKLKTLIHPEAMGETFSVLIQSMDVEASELTGLRPI